eukprot:6825036-Pyramimonas_sp.AAC.2
MAFRAGGVGSPTSVDVLVKAWHNCGVALEALHQPRLALAAAAAALRACATFHGPAHPLTHGLTNRQRALRTALAARLPPIG